MCLTEFDQETYERNMKQEYLEEGRAEGEARGIAKGILQNMISLVKDGFLDLSTAANRLNMTVDEFQSALASH